MKSSEIVRNVCKMSAVVSVIIAILGDIAIVILVIAVSAVIAILIAFMLNVTKTFHDQFRFHDHSLS